MEQKKTEKKLKISKKKLVTGIVIVFTLFFVFAVFDALWKIRKISTGAIWQEPSKVYSDATHITRGTDIEQIGLVSRLTRLGYRQAGNLSSPGEYSKTSGTITIYLHPFEYPEKSFSGEIVKINLYHNIVSSVNRQENEKWQKADEVVIEPEIIAELFGNAYEDRQVIPLSSCPPDLIKAILCTEDRRFYKHHGIDFTSTMRAAFVNLEEGGVAEGGSTITQQLVKNLFLSSKRTITRKIKEAWISLFVEMIYSKDEILEMYINEIYFGQRGYVSINGVARAAKLYFDKELSQLSLEECALLAGIIKAPNYYSPYTHKNRAIARRNTVLEIMRHENKISEDIYKTTIRKPLSVIPLETPKKYASYFIDYVLSCMEKQYPVDYLTRGGYHIFTTMDMHMQSVGETMFAHFMQGVKNRKTPEQLLPEIEGAVLICDPKTGAIKAMIGGTDYVKTQFNRAVQIRRQIGSLIKPVIYYTALRRGYTLSSIIQDEPLTLNLKDGPWSPSNFDEITHGSVLLIDALAQSYNLATVQLGLNIGIENVYAEIKNILPDAKVSKNPSMLLGAIDLSPLDVAKLYFPFANTGVVLNPFVVRAITTDNGAIIYNEGQKTEQKKIDPSIIFLVNEGMGKVITIGTARASFLHGMPWGTHGKTGTTNDLRDSWFVGFTPNLLVVTWLGNDEFLPIGLTGSQGATQVAAMILGALEKPTRWDVPDDIVYCKIDPADGNLASSHSVQAVEIPFIKGTEPTEVSKRKERPRVLRFFRSLFGKD